MFTKKPQDIKKSTAKIQDIKKDSTTRLKHLKTILEHVDSEEAKSIFETNYSHVYYILYDTFVQAENNLKQRVHKTHREELDASLWLLSKILCLLPELISKRWQVHSLSRVIAKLIHHGNGNKLRKDGIRYFLLWYQCLGENAPQHVHAMFNELIPGVTIPHKNFTGPGDVEYNTAQDILNHPNLKGELGTSVFHDTGSHPVQSAEITPLLPPSSSERTAAPDPKDGLELLLECMVQSSGCLKWRENCPQKHIRCFNFLLQRFREVYLPVLCPNFDHSMSVYEPRLDLPVPRSISKKEEVMASCVVVLVNWVAKYTHDKLISGKIDHVQIDEDFGENSSLLSNLRVMGYTQPHLVRDVLYSTKENVNFVHEVYRQAFLLGFTSKNQIEAMRIAISIYKEWISGSAPPFLLEPDEVYTGEREVAPQKPQRLRADSYIGAIGKENPSIRAGLQNVLQIFVTNAVNVFMVQTSHLNIHFQSKSKDGGYTTPLDEQTDVCKRVLNIYRTMVMKTKMEPRTWEQLLLVLLQVTSIILTQATPNSKKNLGGRLAQPIFQTLIVTWIRAHTNVYVNPNMWDKFLKVLSSLTHREELIVEWDKTMQTLTRVMARQVYNLNLLDLPLDRLAEQKGKRRRALQNSSVSASDVPNQNNAASNIKTNESEHGRASCYVRQQVPGTPSLNRSYSEGSLASYRKSRGKRRIKHQQISALPPNIEHSLTRILSNTSTNMSISAETLNNSIIIQAPSNGTLRRALSLDSLRMEKRDGDRNSRSPSPTASSGIEGGSIKDSPMQIDNIGGDSSSIDTQEDVNYSSGKRSILAGGNAKGWLPDVAAIMWKRMLGMLGDVNKILNPKLHAQVFKYLVNMTECLIKIRMNQGISTDNTSTPTPPSVVPPISIITPWCYGALALDNQYQQGKLYAMQILCMIVKQGISLGIDQLPLFYLALHQALTGEDRAMVFTVLRHLGGARFLSLLLPGHSLLLLDFVHASTVVLTSSEIGSHIPRAEVAGLLGSLLSFPKTSLPGPVLQPSEPHVDLMECPDLQEHVLNIVLRCARREPSAKARCIAIAALAHWIVQNCQQHINNSKEPLNPRIVEAMKVILQSLQFKHRTIARIAIESLRLCAEKGRALAKFDSLIPVLINAICISLEIQNVRNPRECDKSVLTSLLLCLGEVCMSIPLKMLLSYKISEEPLILAVLKITYQISKGIYNNHIRLFTPDEDFDQTITLDDIDEQNLNDGYQTAESVEKCQAAIKLCAKTVTMHLVTNLAHFPIGIGASRLSSMVDEQDDLIIPGLSQRKQSETNRDSIDIAANTVITASTIQLFMLNPELVASFIELPALKLPGGGITAGLVTANKQVRLLLRDINGKACWDTSILYREPKLSKDSVDSAYHTPSSMSSMDKPPFFNDYVNDMKVGQPPQFFNKMSGGRIFNTGSSNMDSIISTAPLQMQPLRHTLRHRPPSQLPVANDIAPDLDQLDDLLQYIGHTSPECLVTPGTVLNTAATSPLSPAQEAQTITTILNQRSMESDFLARQSMQSNNCFVPCPSNGESASTSLNYSTYGSKSLTDEPDSNGEQPRSGSYYSERDDLLPFHYGRLLFSQLGLAGWERRRKTYLLKRNDKLLRELRNLDGQRCRETHKVAVIYVANGQEDKNSILRNSCGSSAYEMFVSALGWEIELESHIGFLGGLPRQGCGSTAPYYATPFLEIIYHVATRMPTDSPEAILTKTRHLGNDEVHIVWSEHYRDYRRDIIATEFCDVLIIIYPLKSGLFRVTVNRKPDVPWFGPLADESVVGGVCLASLVRATAINASRAKRLSLSFYQQFYEERSRSLDVVSSRHKEPTTYEEFVSRLYSPVQNASNTISTSTTASALIDHPKIKRSSTSKNYFNHPEVTVSARELSNHAMQSVSLDHPSPRPLRKIHHPFKAVQRKSHSNASSTSTISQQPSMNQTPPDSPTAPIRKFK